MANIITASRILLSIALLFCPAFSPAFYVLYVAGGASDMIDGAVARKTGTAGKLGSRLDTIADFVFTAVCLIKLLPMLLLFVFPLTLTWIDLRYSAAVVCAVATTAAVYEGYLILTRRTA